ncbi:unnamed protein product [Ascophyllum nodosum]
MVDTPRSSRRRRWDGSIQSTPNAHGLTSSRQQQVEYPPRRDSTAGSSSRRRRNSRRGRGQTSVVIGLAAAASLGRTRAQYVDGGSVSMDCEVCYCDGSTDDGTVEVFDNPSSGQRMAHLDGVFSEILETTCDSTIIQLGETIYELSGLDLTDRTLEVLDLSSDDCTASSDTPSSADCYTGETTVDLDNGLEVDLSFCVCKWEEGLTSLYRSNVGAVVSGASEVDVPNDEMSICVMDEFTTQMFATVIEGETTYFSFELAIPGDGSSADITVEDAPSSTAESFICGELEETPSPEAPTPEPTPESLPEPTPEPTAESTPQPIPDRLRNPLRKRRRNQFPSRLRNPLRKRRRNQFPSRLRNPLRKRRRSQLQNQLLNRLRNPLRNQLLRRQLPNQLRNPRPNQLRHRRPNPLRKQQKPHRNQLRNPLRHPNQYQNLRRHQHQNLHRHQHQNPRRHQHQNPRQLQHLKPHRRLPHRPR